MILLLLNAAAVHLSAQRSEDERKLFEETKSLAESGNARAQSYLGFMYANGRGTPKDQAEAVKWFRNSATQDSPTRNSTSPSRMLLAKG